MHITIDERWRVRGEASITLPASSSAAWGQLRDWRRFLTIDPLHERIDLKSPAHGGPSPRGTTFTIRHRLLGIGPNRDGRLLTWREGRGYAISDLSRRGVHVGFPHICTYALYPLDEHRTRLDLGVRGVWTARWMPRLLIRAWIAFILRATEYRIRAEFAAFACWRERRRRSPRPG
jgi:hypothetical protein